MTRARLFFSERAQRLKPPHETSRLDGQTYRLTRLSDCRYDDSGVRVSRSTRISPSNSHCPGPPSWTWRRRTRSADTCSASAGGFLTIAKGISRSRWRWRFRRVRCSGVFVQRDELPQRRGVPSRKLVDPTDKRLKEPLLYPRTPTSFPVRRSTGSRVSSSDSWRASSNRSGPGGRIVSCWP